MRYLSKNQADYFREQGWKYPRDSAYIKEALLKEQRGYCAYTEEWIGKRTSSSEIEHFYPDLKHTEQDRYDYWYLVCRWINGNKARKVEGTKDGKTKTHLPLPDPFDSSLQKRISYDTDLHEFYSVDDDDIEAVNFLRWTGMNKTDLVGDREEHIDRLLEDFESRGIDGKPDEIARYLANKPKLCEYATAMEKAFAVVLP